MALVMVTVSPLLLPLPCWKVWSRQPWWGSPASAGRRLELLLRTPCTSRHLLLATVVSENATMLGPTLNVLSPVVKPASDALWIVNPASLMELSVHVKLTAGRSL